MSKFYITTAIDYPNSRPHIGTAFEKIGADVQARYRRLKGDDVFFLMGNDENTLRVSERAKKLNLDTKTYVDDMAEQFKSVWKLLNISNDGFIQTTSKEHAVTVHDFITKVYEAGYIYKKKYKAPYCIGCEEFKTPKSLENGKCLNHFHIEIQEAEEENYFFKLSHFKHLVRDLLTSGKVKVKPEPRYNQIMSLLEEDLEDISISRQNQKWGIPIPWDNSQVIYVWFDALINYISGANNNWPADCHVIGKDITRFHCILWLAMIAAYNEKAEKPIAFPKKVFSHGFITQKGNKISKSGNFIDPVEVVNEYSTDAYRYYFLSKCPFASDGEYDSDHFKEVYNAELVNNLGNLLSRTFNLIKKYGADNVKAKMGDKVQWTNSGSDMFSELREIVWISDCGDWVRVEDSCTGIPIEEVSAKDKTIWTNAADFNFWERKIEDFDYRSVLSKVWEILDKANKYLEVNKPWDASSVNRGVVLRNVAVCLRTVSLMIKPFLPETAEKIYETFSWPDEWKALTWHKIRGIISNNYIALNEIKLKSETCNHLFPRKK